MQSAAQRNTHHATRPHALDGPCPPCYTAPARAYLTLWSKNPMFKGIGIDVATNRLDVLDRDLARCVALGFAAAELNTYVGTVIRSGQVVPAELARVRQILAHCS